MAKFSGILEIREITISYCLSILKKKIKSKSDLLKAIVLSYSKDGLDANQTNETLKAFNYSGTIETYKTRKELTRLANYESEQFTPSARTELISGLYKKDIISYKDMFVLLLGGCHIESITEENIKETAKTLNLEKEYNQIILELNQENEKRKKIVN